VVVSVPGGDGRARPTDKIREAGGLVWLPVCAQGLFPDLISEEEEEGQEEEEEARKSTERGFEWKLVPQREFEFRGRLLPEV